MPEPSNTITFTVELPDQTVPVQLEVHPAAPVTIGVKVGDVLILETTGGSGGGRGANVVLSAPSLTPEAGDELSAMWFQGTDSSGNPVWSPIGSWTWSGTYVGEDEQFVLLMLPEDVWPTVYARVTTGGFVPIVVNALESVTVGCAGTGFGPSPSDWVGINADDPLNGIPDPRTPATSFIPKGITSASVWPVSEQEGGFTGLFAAVAGSPLSRLLDIMDQLTAGGGSVQVATADVYSPAAFAVDGSIPAPAGTTIGTYDPDQEGGPGVYTVGEDIIPRLTTPLERGVALVSVINGDTFDNDPAIWYFDNLGHQPINLLEGLGGISGVTPIGAIITGDISDPTAITYIQRNGDTSLTLNAAGMDAEVALLHDNGTLYTTTGSGVDGGTAAADGLYESTTIGATPASGLLAVVAGGTVYIQMSGGGGTAADTSFDNTEANLPDPDPEADPAVPPADLQRAVESLTTLVNTLFDRLEALEPHGRPVNQDFDVEEGDANGIITIDAYLNDVTGTADASVIPQFSTATFARTDPSGFTVHVLGTFDGDPNGIFLDAIGVGPFNSKRYYSDGSQWRSA